MDAFYSQSLRALKYSLFVSLLILSGSANSATYYSRASGNFNTATTWSTAGCGGIAAATVPGAADSAVICNGYTVSVTANAPVKSVTILSGGILQTGTTGGGANKTLTLTGTFNIQDGGLYIHNNNADADQTIFAGTEIFTLNSTIRVDAWSGTADPFITGINSNFGNLTLNWNPGAFYWNNQGLGFTRTIARSFIVQGGCATYLDANAGNVTFSIGSNLTVNSSLLRFKQVASGDVTINIGGTISLTGTSIVYGIYQEDGTLTLNSNSINISGGTMYGIYNGDGNAQFNISGTYTQSAGDFRGIQNIATFTAGTASYLIGSINYTGGVFIGNYGCHVGNKVIQFNVTGNMSVSFSAAGDLYSINRLATLSATPTTASLNFTVGGNLTIGGTAMGEFNSNNGTGVETVSITGNLIISNGNNYFNVVPSFGANGHNSTITVNGTMNISGGNTILSSEKGNLTFTLEGASTISGGTISAKAETGTGVLSFNSSYTQSGGTFMHYNNATEVSSDAVAATVLGNFSHSGGTINFGNNITAIAVNSITLKGAAYSISGTGSMTRAGAGTAVTFGMLYFNRTGTINFTRAGTHNIQQVKQVVMAACTLDVISGNVQIASHATPAVDYFTVSALSVLNLRGSQVYSNATAINSGVTVADNGRLRTTHASGLYNNTTVAAFNNTGALNYFLGANSVVEYYGTANQIMTGINVGLALTAQHKYGICEINQSTPGVWVAPTNLPSASGNVFVRTELRLTSGELNLANASGNPASGGRVVTVENGLAAGITRNTGYIRSEARDFSGAIDWIIGSNTGLHVMPFAYSSSQFIPVNYNLQSGNAATVRFATYNTPATNLPWPPTVNNLNSIIGLSPDNRDATSDRFWQIASGGTPVTTLTLTYLSTELPVSPYNDPLQMQAQHYNPTVNKWQPALPGQSAIAFAVTIPGVSNQAIWTLSNIASPLPVTWISFTGMIVENTVLLEWATASETNSDYFVLERSKDQLHIDELGKVDAAGFSSQTIQYNFTDYQPYEGLSYYRLKQTDLNGQYEYSDWISVRFGKIGSVLSVFPNPASDVIKLDGLSLGNVELIDASGRLVYSVTKTDPGQLIIQVTAFPRGKYILRYNGEGEPQKTGVILQ
jgi:hypothetical protein